MSRHGILISLLGLVVASVAMAQDEPSCPEATFRAQLMTPVAGRIPRDASLVVGLFAGGEATGLPAITLTRRRRELALVREAIAPGLFRLRPDTRRLSGRWDLQGVEGNPRLIFGRPGAGAAPPAPRLERVERYLVAGAEGSRAEVRAHFAFPIPEGIVAVVSYWGDDDDADLFVRATPAIRETVLFASSGRCPALPEGASAPPETGAVRVAFVDRYGHLSARSEPRPLGR